MVVTVDSTNPRSVAALGLMLKADKWQRGHRKADGRKFYAIPSRSRPDLYHMTDCRECTCEDFTKRGVECAHILAVRLHVDRVKLSHATRGRKEGGYQRPPRTPEQTAALNEKYVEMFQE